MFHGVRFVFAAIVKAGGMFFWFLVIAKCSASGNEDVVVDIALGGFAGLLLRLGVDQGLISGEISWGKDLRRVLLSVSIFQVPVLIVFVLFGVSHLSVVMAFAIPHVGYLSTYCKVRGMPVSACLMEVVPVYAITAVLYLAEPTSFEVLVVQVVGAIGGFVVLFVWSFSRLQGNSGFVGVLRLRRFLVNFYDASIQWGLITLLSFLPSTDVTSVAIVQRVLALQVNTMNVINTFVLTRVRAAYQDHGRLNLSMSRKLRLASVLVGLFAVVVLVYFGGEVGFAGLAVLALMIGLMACTGPVLFLSLCKYGSNYVFRFQFGEMLGYLFVLWVATFVEVDNIGIYLVVSIMAASRLIVMFHSRVFSGRVSDC
ncbi:hypothetical protein ACH42_01175 [Endozoicomonas sp. (ex Bugula neritina AB1)]|nr:hypothetical protein ACH42_01175 [Endozoicomonas sp. (ex Bugula neritina AB1)]